MSDFNVEAFIKERTQYWHLMDRKVMALDDVLYLVAQLLPPGHVVVPREDLQAIIQSLIPNELSAARRKALRRLESLLMPLIASSGPEQPKCSTCKGRKSVYHEDSDRYDKCPDCAKDRAEPKCVCPDHDLMAVPHTIICNDFVAMKNPENKKCGRCAHIRTCHTPAPAAKEVMPRSE